MDYDTTTDARRHTSPYRVLFRVAGALLVLTMLSTWMACGLFARYVSQNSAGDSATVATVGGVSVYEHQSVLQTNLKSTLDGDSLYTLNGTVVASNSYLAVPGTTIPKDPYVVLDGTNDVACTLYLEVVDGSGGYVSYSLKDGWTKATDSDGFEPTHGGTLYRYTEPVSAHTEKTVTDVLTGNAVRISDGYTDRNDPTRNANTLSINFYAYLVQID
jgi:hypothetical protein